jgi:hypothetical protein
MPAGASELASGGRGAVAGLALAAALFAGCASVYAIATPLGQAPDEKLHLGYIQLIAQHLQLPVDTPERQQPPLYYLFAAALSRLTESVGVLQAMSILLGAATVVVVGLCAREVWPARPILWVEASLIAGALPQFQFIAASVSNDALSVLAAAILTYLMIRVALRPPEARIAWAIGVAFAIALLAKETTYFLIPALLVTLLRFWPQRDWAPGLLPMIALPVVLAGWWFVRNLITFHSPLPSLIPLYTNVPLKLTDSSLLNNWGNLTFQSFFARFGNNSTLIQPQAIVYPLLEDAAALLLVIGAAAAAMRWRSWPANARWVAGACIVIPLVALGQMVVNSITIDYQPQGRYLFVAGPLLALGAVFAVNAMTSRLPRWVSLGMWTMLLSAGLALDLMGLYTDWFGLIKT